MKESRLFYCPDIEKCAELPQDEALHIVRVLRLKEGDPLWLTDGKGHSFQAQITQANAKHCTVDITSRADVEKPWAGWLHVAMAPTKNMDRTEWMVEKTVEIGIDCITFLDCDFSERRQIRTDRLEKIAVSAMKQSHKMWKPQINGMTRFNHFVTKEHEGPKFIAHCYDEADIQGSAQGKPLLQHVLSSHSSALVCIGPEGDFSIDEVNAAIHHGFIPVSLGTSRLRTETAAVVATHLMQLFTR